MQDRQCIEFLRWALPCLGLQWRGFRKVRRQVCRRIATRMGVLGLTGIASYRAHLEATPAEWRRLNSCCVVTISRFYRDRGVYQGLGEHVLPQLAARRVAAGEGRLRVWSAGCASGEEPYSLGLLWSLRVARHFPDLRLAIVATDSQPDLLARARRACYRHSSLRELPSSWIEAGFTEHAAEWCLNPPFRQSVRFLCHDLASGSLPGTFDLVLCRNLVFTYFTPARQRAFLRNLVHHLAPGGALVVGSHEVLPPDIGDFTPWARAPCVWRSG